MTPNSDAVHKKRTIASNRTATNAYAQNAEGTPQIGGPPTRIENVRFVAQLMIDGSPAQKIKQRRASMKERTDNSDPRRSITALRVKKQRLFQKTNERLSSKPI